MLFLILRYLLDLRSPSKRQVKPSALASQHYQQKSRLGHEESKSRWKYFPVTKADFPKHTCACPPRPLLCFIMETQAKQTEVKMLPRWTAGSAPALHRCTSPLQRKAERKQILKFLTTLFSSVLRHGYQRDIFPPPSLLFAQKCSKGIWIFVKQTQPINQQCCLESSGQWETSYFSFDLKRVSECSQYLQRQVYNLLYLSSPGCKHLNITPQNLSAKHPKHSVWVA